MVKGDGPQQVSYGGVHRHRAFFPGLSQSKGPVLARLSTTKAGYTKGFGKDSEGRMHMKDLMAFESTVKNGLELNKKPHIALLQVGNNGVMLSQGPRGKNQQQLRNTIGKFQGINRELFDTELMQSWFNTPGGYDNKDGVDINARKDKYHQQLEDEKKLTHRILKRRGRWMSALPGTQPGYNRYGNDAGDATESEDDIINTRIPPPKRGGKIGKARKKKK